MNTLKNIQNFPYFLSFYSLTEDEQFSYFRMKEDIERDFEEKTFSPTLRKDIKRLVMEIDQGNVFMNQSKELREVIQQVKC